MKLVQKLVTADSFDALGKFVKEGEIGTFDKDTLSGEETHLMPVPKVMEPEPEIAPISPVNANLGYAAELDALRQEIARLRSEKGLDDNDGLVDGNVEQVIADLGAKSDAELDALAAAEKDRQKPRKGVLDAIKAELAARNKA